jgi:hypothetical protein
LFQERPAPKANPAPEEEAPVEEDDPESDLDLDMEGVIRGEAFPRRRGRRQIHVFFCCPF